MADNIVLNPGTGGDNLAAKEIAGSPAVKHQQVIPEFMHATTPTPVSDSTAGSAFPVQLLDGGLNVANIFPAGFQRVSDEPRQLFYDPFDTALDTTTRWNAGTVGTGGTAAAVSGGVLTLATNTATTAFSMLESRPSFLPTVPGWLGASFALALSHAPSGGWDNARAFWGMGTSPGTPTTAAPLTNAYGFEVTEFGFMNAVVYINGTRTIVSALSSVADTAYHRYSVYYRTDKIYWYIDGLTTPVATANYVVPQVQTLPIKLLVVNYTSGPSAGRSILTHGLAVWDTAKNNTTLSDVDYPWRKAGLNPKGTQAAYGLGVQQLKDAGRTHVNYYATAAAAAATATEAMVTLTKAPGTGSTSTGTSFTPSSGKRFRITSITFATRGNATATIQTTTFSLRINTAGATVNSSTPVVFQARCATPATASAWDRFQLPIPDGFEILGDGTLTFGISAISTYVTNAPTLDVMITGFEY